MELLLSERVGVSLQMSDCEKLNKTAVAAVKTVIEAAERGATCFLPRVLSWWDTTRTLPAADGEEGVRVQDVKLRRPRLEGES